jgi:hypothetical protein
MTEEQVTAALLTSPEYLAQFKGDNTAWLQGVYRDLFGRTGDTGGLAFWQAQLQTGSQQQVALGFATSGEWLGDRVSGLYTDLLGRNADAGGIAFWTGAAKAGTRFENIVAGFVASTEYYQRQDLGAGSPTQWLSNAYSDVLLRGADPSELTFWLTQLANTSK